MDKTRQTNGNPEAKDLTAEGDAENHTTSEGSNSNDCTVGLLTEPADSANSGGLETVENNHCAIAMKTDSNNCDTNPLSSTVCDIDGTCGDNSQNSFQDGTTLLQQNDSALVMSPISDGSMMDTSGGLETQFEGTLFTNTGVDCLTVAKTDDSGIFVEREEGSRLSQPQVLKSTLTTTSENNFGAKHEDTTMQVSNGLKPLEYCEQDEDIFMDSNEGIVHKKEATETLSKESDLSDDMQIKETEKESLSVLDSPKLSDTVVAGQSHNKGITLVPGFSSDSNISDEEVQQAGGCRKLKNKKIKPLVDYDDSDDTSGPTSYDLSQTKRPSEKSESNSSSSSSSSDSDEEMDALDVFLARRKRQMDSERSSETSQHGDEEDDNDNPNTDEKPMRAESDDDEVDSGSSRLPKDPWSPLLEVRARELGTSNRTYGAEQFRAGCGASVNLVQRLQRQSRLDSHEGCVNALHFNKSGTSLASGSDDLNIVVWDWIHEKPFFTFDSGHRSNVFQCKFMPYTGDSHLVSCARDGQIRLAELSSTGKCKNTRKLALHRGAAHKLALLEDSSHVFYSCGEDAVVYEIDLRQEKPNRLCTTKEKDRKIPLYSIHSNPFKSYEYCVGGRDHFLRVYDKRKMAGDGNSDSEVKKFCPHHLMDNDTKANVTCAVYNWNGMEVLGTYNDEDIYLFDNTHSDGATHVHSYKGHRNNATVKGVNFYGPKSEFIVSGSDCGNVFLWEKESESIVNYFKADEAGVVNVLEPHPHMPVLATSGLDHDVKVWSPHAAEPTKLDGLAKLVKKNRKERTEERSSDPDMYDGHMLWFLMHHLRRARRIRGSRGGAGGDGGSSTDSDDVERGESDNSEDEEPMQCVPS